MTHKVAKALVSILLVGSTAVSVAAQGRSTYPLADQADAIVVGDVQSGRQTGNALAFTLNVARTIKGSVAPGSALTVSGVSAVGVNRDLTGIYGMFFLNKAGTSHWTLLPVARGFSLEIPRASSPASITTSPPASSVNDLIAVELAAGLQAYAGSSQNYGLYQMESALMAMPDSPVVRSLFQTLRTSFKPEPRFLALAKAMKAGDLSALAEVADNVALLPQLTARAFVMTGIIAQGFSGSSAPVGSLNLIAQSSDVYVQRSAANALMNIHTRDTLPSLARLLDSADVATRELAMSGLSRFVDNLPPLTHYNVPNGRASIAESPAPYRTEQTERYSLSTRRLAGAPEPEVAFLQFWKSWWATMKDKIMGK